jgi:hypothetical protein
VKALRFRIPIETFQNNATNPKNVAYYASGANGFLNVSACEFKAPVCGPCAASGSPSIAHICTHTHELALLVFDESVQVFMSKPRFLECDSYVNESLTGMLPAGPELDPFLDVEPVGVRPYLLTCHRVFAFPSLP